MSDNRDLMRILNQLERLLDDATQRANKDTDEGSRLPAVQRAYYHGTAFGIEIAIGHIAELVTDAMHATIKSE